MSRSLSIEASPQKIFPLLNDLRAWDLWSPWEQGVGERTKTYSGPDAGAGQHYRWAGKKSGIGELLITASIPPQDAEDNKIASELQVELTYIKPFKSNSVNTFTLPKEPTGTLVTWTLEGNHGSALARISSKFMNMDKIMGREFTQGLQALSDYVTTH